MRIGGKRRRSSRPRRTWASRSRRSGSWPSRRRVERATTWRASRRDWSSVKVRARRRDRELAWTRREPRPVNAGIRRIARFSRRVARPRRLNLILARVIPPLTRPPSPRTRARRLQLRGVPGHAHQRPAHLQRRESFRGERQARRRRRRLHRGAPPSPIRSFHPNPNRASPGIHRSSSRVGPVLGDDSQNLKFSL